MPSSNCGDDFVGIGDPLEGFRASVVILEEVEWRLSVRNGAAKAELKPSVLALA